MKYFEDILLPCYMFDCRAKLRPSSFLDIAQEAAAMSATRSGFSDKVLMEHGLVWILSRMDIRFLRLPQRLDRVRFETWHKGVSGPYFLRDYKMLDPDGEILARGTSCWAVMDFESRRAVRPDRLTDIISPEAEDEDSAVDEIARKLLVPAGAELQEGGTHRVNYSDLDYNGHANNAKYIQWAVDALPAEISTAKDLGRMEINFNAESRLGEDIELKTCCGDGVCYVEGFSGGTRRFISALDWRD